MLGGLHEFLDGLSLVFDINSQFTDLGIKSFHAFHREPSILYLPQQPSTRARFNGLLEFPTEYPSDRY
jgi:hypothetical protein